MSRKDAIRRHYESRIAPGRPGYDIADWSSQASQQLRFQVLADNVPLAGRTLLDVGCGVGDLCRYLKARKVPVAYTGVDLSDRLLTLARARHPEAHFQAADVFAPGPPPLGTFDVVFCSGAFNLDLGNNLLFLPRAVARLVEMSRRFTAFNLLHARARRKYPGYVYYDPAEVAAILRALPCRARVIDDYLDNDFAVVCAIQRPEGEAP